MDAEKKRKKRAKQEGLHQIKDSELAHLREELADLAESHYGALTAIEELHTQNQSLRKACGMVPTPPPVLPQGDRKRRRRDEGLQGTSVSRTCRA